MSSENSFILLSAFTPGSNSVKKSKTLSRNNILTLKRNLKFTAEVESDTQKVVDNTKVIEIIDTNCKNTSYLSPKNCSLISISSTDESLNFDEENSTTSKNSEFSDLKNNLLEMNSTNRNFNCMTPDDSKNLENFHMTNYKSTSCKDVEYTLNNEMEYLHQNTSTVNSKLFYLDNDVKTCDKLNSTSSLNEYVNNSMLHSVIIIESTDDERNQDNSSNISTDSNVQENNHNITTYEDNILISETDSQKILVEFINTNEKITINESCTSNTSNKLLNNVLIQESLDVSKKQSIMDPFTIDETRTTISSNSLSENNKISNVILDFNNKFKKNQNRLFELNTDICAETLNTSFNILTKECENSNKSNQMHQLIVIDETNSSIHSIKSNSILIEESENLLKNQNSIKSSSVFESILTENLTSSISNQSHQILVQKFENLSKNINASETAIKELIAPSENNLEANLSLMTSDNSEIREIDKFESIITLDKTDQVNNVKINSDLSLKERRSSLLTSDESHIKMDKLKLSNNSEDALATNVVKTDFITLLTSDESCTEMDKLHLSFSNNHSNYSSNVKNSDLKNDSDSSNISYTTASNISTKFTTNMNQENQKLSPVTTPIKNKIDIEDNVVDCEFQIQTSIDKNTELVLDQLYGIKWRNRLKMTPKSEPRNGSNRHVITNNAVPNTERKVKKSNVAEISKTSINFNDFAHRIRPDFESTRTPITRKKINSFIVSHHDPEVHLNTSSVSNFIQKPIQNQLKQAIAIENCKKAFESHSIKKNKQFCDSDENESSDKENEYLKKTPRQYNDKQVESCSFSMQKLYLSESPIPKVNENHLSKEFKIMNNDITDAFQMEKLKISSDSNDCNSKNSIEMDKLRLSNSEKHAETETNSEFIEVLPTKSSKITINTPKTNIFITPKNVNRIRPKNEAQTTQGKRKLFSQKRFEDDNSLINSCNEEFPEVTRLTYNSFVSNSQVDEKKTYVDLVYEQMMKKAEKKKKKQNKLKDSSIIAKEKIETTKKTIIKKQSTESTQSESLIPTTKIARSATKPVQRTNYSETNSDTNTNKKKILTCEKTCKTKKKINQKLQYNNSSDDEYIPTPIKNKRSKSKVNNCRKFTTESSSSNSEDEQQYNTYVPKSIRPFSRLAHITSNSNSSSESNTPKRNCKILNEVNKIIVLTSSDDDDIQCQSDSSNTSFEIQTPNQNKIESKTQLSFLASLSACVSTMLSHPDAHPYKLYFKDKKEELATRLFKLYNQTIFDEKIPQDTPIQWNVRMRGTAGFCYNKKTTRSTGEIERTCRIVLSSKVIDHPSRLRDTLIHEMCHAATWIVNQVSDGHGPYWKAWAMKAMKTYPELPSIKRCHDYEINTKYTYKCTSCGYSIGRHSKSLDTERKRCGYCYGKFELLLNKKLKNGIVKSVPTRKCNQLSGFAKFVKENYNAIKGNSNMKHEDVMKMLGQKFSILKVTDGMVCS